MSGSPACDLCDSPVPEHRESGFCSAGCRSVAETLPEPPERDAPEVSSDEGNDGTTSVFFAVEGMHSATCEAYLEAVAEGIEGVVGADASYVTESVRVDCASEPPTERLQAALSGLGYDATPRDATDDSPVETGDGVVEGALGYRYAAGVVFASFLLIPYTVVFYPSHLAALVGATDPLAGSNITMVLPVFLVLTLVVILVTGAPVLRDAYIALKLRQPNTGLLVTLTAFAAYVYGTAAFFAGGTGAYYDLAVVTVAAVTAATFYESLAKRNAASALTDLTVSRVEQATRQTDAGTETVAVSDLSPGDRVLVPEGERVPVDGTLDEGECTVAEAVVTGESTPVRKQAGDELVGGSVVTAGAAVLSVGDDVASSVDRLAASVWGFQSATHGGQRRANRIAERVTPPLVAVALLAGVGAFALGQGVAGSVVAALTVPLAASPWALGFATPLSAGTSVTRALDRGVAVFDETVFERLRDVETVVFDKTGTLTTGRMEVLDHDASADLLAATAALERRAAHPAAAAIVDAFGDGQTDASAGESPDIESFTSHATGVEGVVDGRRVLVGNPDLFAERGWEMSEEIGQRATEARESGRLPVIVGETSETGAGATGEATGIVLVGDESRPDWEATLERLATRGLRVVVLTGDDESAAEQFAASPHVEHVFAGVPPAGKAAAVRRLRAEGPVAMVGDGTNDAPALAAADLGISLGSGTALAAEASDLAVVDDDLGGVAAAFDLSAESYQRRRWNDRGALLYNALAVPLTLAGLLNPLLTMAAAVGCCGLVAANAFRESRVA